MRNEFAGASRIPDCHATTAIQKILFPVDFSPSCVAMAPFVKRGAAILGASVTLLHVFDIYSPNAVQLYVRPPSEVAEDQRKVAQNRLDSFLAAEFPAGETRRILLSGDAAHQIAQFAGADGIDLIIMPTHAGVFRRTLLGSTTAKVLDGADCPVLTTQHAQTISPRQIDHREWICAIDLNGNSERVLQYSSRIAQTVHGNVTLVHVIPSGGAAASPELDLAERLELEKREAASRRIEELQSAAHSHARVRIAIGPVKDMLVEEAHRLQADVLVIGRHPQFGMQGRLRDLSYAVILDAPCPVLSV